MSQGVKDLQPRLVPLVPSLPLGELIPRRRPLALIVLFQVSEISIGLARSNFAEKPRGKERVIHQQNRLSSPDSSSDEAVEKSMEKVPYPRGISQSKSPNRERPLNHRFKPRSAD